MTRFITLVLIAAALLSSAESPFACNRTALDAQARKRHFDELGPRLRALTNGFRELRDGYEFAFPADAAGLVWEWTQGERRCCPFFEINLRFEREGGALWLRLTGRDGTKDFIRTDFARWLEQGSSPRP